ncbi:MAG: hypothetical protein WCH01_10440 [Methylococcaceae bacterium]
MNKKMIEPFNLDTMAIADKVNNYIQTCYYKIQLAALQTAVEKIGGTFVQRPRLDDLPQEVEEHLAFAVILAREAYLSPKESPYEHYLVAERRLEDGYAVALLRVIIEALDALGLYLHVQQDAYILEVIEAERHQWAMDAYVTTIRSFPTSASEAEPTTTKSTEDLGVLADAFLSCFFENDKIHNIAVGKNERA